MNYGIIAYKEDSSYRDRCDDWVSRPGFFVTHFFRDEREAFIKTWAELQFEGEYEELVIMINGVPDNYMTKEEEVEYWKADEERSALYDGLVEAKKIADKIKRDELAEAALQKVREIDAARKARDLADYEALKLKLGK